jgi:hypothetical protein
MQPHWQQLRQQKKQQHVNQQQQQKTHCLYVLYLLGPFHLSGPTGRVFLPYIFYGLAFLCCFRQKLENAKNCNFQ